MIVLTIFTFYKYSSMYHANNMKTEIIEFDNNQIPTCFTYVS